MHYTTYLQLFAMLLSSVFFLTINCLCSTLKTIIKKNLIFSYIRYVNIFAMLIKKFKQRK